MRTGHRQIALQYLRVADEKLGGAVDPVARGLTTSRPTMLATARQLELAHVFTSSSDAVQRGRLSALVDDLHRVAGMSRSQLRTPVVVPPNLATRHPIPGRASTQGLEALAAIRSDLHEAIRGAEQVGGARVGRGLLLGGGALAVAGVIAMVASPDR